MLLKKYVDSDGMVNYQLWHKSPDDRKALQHYIANLSRADHERPATRDAQIAYWINAYNAVTLEEFLQFTQQTAFATTLATGIQHLGRLQFISGDRSHSLNDIEHKVLRKMGEPRIHFAIVCASIGCPRLLNQAYSADKLEEQLVANSRDFFSRSRNLQFDRGTNRLKLSSIMKWFGSDFGNSQTERVKAIARYLPTHVQTAIATNEYSVSYLDYDWKLNSQ